MSGTLIARFVRSATLAIGCFVASWATTSLCARDLDDALENSTPRLREQADAVRRYNFDAAAATRSLRFLELTGRRIWGYVDDGGAARAYEGAYDAEVVRSGKPCLMFTSKQYVPVANLDAKATTELAEIDKLRSELRQDYAQLQAELARRQAAAIEAERRAELQRQAELDKLKRRQARLLVDTDLTVVESGVARVLNLGAGEIFEIAGDSPTEFLLVVGGRPTAVDRRRCEELNPTVVLRPIAPGGEVPPVGAAPPPKLDARIGSYVFPDGRIALQIEAVALGGLADRYQLQVGDVIERVNEMAVGTLDDYRIASTRAGGGLKLVLFRPDIGKSRIVEIPPPNAAVPLGVFGRTDFRQEFVIDDVLEGSIAEQIGLKRNDKILRVNDLPITSEAQLRHAEATSGGNFRVRALLDGQPKTLVFP